MNELNLPFRLEPLSWSGYAWANLAAAVLATAWLGVLFWRDRRVAARPAFMVALLAVAVFQWPTWVFSGVLERALAPHWLLSLHLQALVLGLLAWATVTPALTGRLRLAREDMQDEAQFRIVASLCVLAIGAVLVALYLQRVGLSCTGLASTVLDPEFALLARELSIKMAGGGVPTFAHALVVSVVSPVAVFLALQHAIVSVRRRRAWPLVANAVVILFFLLAVLLPGAKGNLMPTLVASALGLSFHARGWHQRMLHVALVGIVGLAALVAVEMVKEKRYFQGESRYPFARCVERLDICVPMRELLNSMSSRDYALGISAGTIDWLHADLEQRCVVALPPREPFAFELAPDQARIIEERRRPPAAARAQGSAPAASAAPASSVPAASSANGPSGAPPRVAPADAAEPRRPVAEMQRVGETFPVRAWNYALTVAYRALVVPLQVAAWHYDFVERVGRPGAAVLPTAHWTHGARVTEMPARIHDHYSPGYSAGAKIATGTSPSSFLVSYSAPMGTAGLWLALACVIAFDALVAWVIGRAQPPLKPLGIAMMAVAALNLMLTDFETTMVSHGAIAALMLLFGLDLAHRVVRWCLAHRRSLP